MELDLSQNKGLRKLSNGLGKLSVWDFRCGGCWNLIEPPYAVCQGGFDAIKQYYLDLETGKELLSLTTAVVIGRKMAGKSSLVRSLHSKQIMKTDRSQEAPVDATT